MVCRVLWLLLARLSLSGLGLLCWLLTNGVLRCLRRLLHGLLSRCLLDRLRSLRCLLDRGLGRGLGVGLPGAVVGQWLAMRGVLAGHLRAHVLGGLLTAALSRAFVVDRDSRILVQRRLVDAALIVGLLGGHVGGSELAAAPRGTVKTASATAIWWAGSPRQGCGAGAGVILR